MPESTLKAARESTDLSPQVHQQILAALTIGSLPDVFWLHDDDLCDCTFQRIGQWTNPYLAETLEVRLCCLWRELYKLFPQFVREVPAYYNPNLHQWQAEPVPWDSEDSDMPLPIWYRQMARKTGKALAEIRQEYRGRERERPKRVKKGMGWESRQPTDAQVAAAQRARLIATGWLLEGQS